MDIERKKVWREIRSFSCWDMEGSFDEVITKLLQYRDENKDKKLRFSTESNEYDNDYHTELQYEDDENDKEYATRISQEKKSDDKQAQRDKEEYERLKAKFEPKPKVCTQHKIIKKGENGWTSARCSECGETFGWWCDKSPDKSCHYFTELNGKVPSPNVCVKLINDVLFSMPDPNYDRRFETEDCCLFCGEPQERK